ncbi:MAG: alkaline phosphatase D family protein, partial [Pseudomonadota bacterium]
RRHFVCDVGELARFVFLDTRQFRDSQSVCGAGSSPPIPGSTNPSIQPGCAELEAPDRTMLGRAQREFLLESLSGSNAKWNFIVSTCVMAPFDFDPPHNARYLYGWDGYPGERAALLAHIERHAVPNPVVLSGDWHSFWVNDVVAPGVPQCRNAPVEFATSGVTSRYPGNAELMRRSQAANTQVRYLNTEDRGYMRFSVTPTKLTAACVSVDCKSPDGSPAREVARFEEDRSTPDNE